MTQETVLVPDIGGSDAAEVVEVLVAPGDRVAIDDGLLVLESDKASMEIPSTAAGTIVEVLAKEGDQLAEGAPVAVIETDTDTDTNTETHTETASGGGEPSEAGGASASTAADASADTAIPSTPEASAPAATADRESATVEVPVPDIGTDDAVDLIEISVSEGDTVDEGDTLVVLESDKASMEVPAPSAGVVRKLLVTEEQQVRQGDALLMLEVVSGGASEGASEGGAPSPSQAQTETDTRPQSPPAAEAAEKGQRAPSPAASADDPAKPAATAAPATTKGSVYAGPAVRRLAREFGVPLDGVTASGPRGRILKDDLQAYVKRALTAPAAGAASAGIAAVPEVDFAAFGPVEVVPRSKIDKVTAQNMQRSWLNVPHVTQFDDADITEMEAFRKSLAAEAEKRGTRLTPLPFLLKACAVALARHEKLNASLSDGGETLTYKRYVHIGMAVDTPAGLVVPVVRDVDQKSLWDLAEEVLDLASRARDRKLKPAEMQGGGFTISSLGAIGGRGFTPIVNAPEVAILGVSRASTQPVWDGEGFSPRLMLPLALSYDHRVVNGGDAGRFTTELCALLGDIRKLLL